ncbi:hypothetical protein QL285_023132 [Trifolium repens]|nr:hypothetical protein QL285_023132 [Trifolium repens]
MRVCKIRVKNILKIFDDVAKYLFISPIAIEIVHHTFRVVASTQSTFLKGRYLVDGVMVVNEVVDMAKKSGNDCLIFKVDFEKAYDSVDWSFLDYMLQRFGFSDQWRKCIRACVFSGSMSILVNESPRQWRLHVAVRGFN